MSGFKVNLKSEINIKCLGLASSLIISKIKVHPILDATDGFVGCWAWVMCITKDLNEIYDS